MRIIPDFGPAITARGATSPLSVRLKIKTPVVPFPLRLETTSKLCTGSTDTPRTSSNPVFSPRIIRNGATSPLASLGQNKTSCPTSSPTTISLFFTSTFTVSGRRMRVWSLNYPYRRLFPAGARPEHQNGPRQMHRHDDLVVHRVVRDAVHRPAQFRSLAFDYPYRPFVSVCQPGKHQYPGYAHSIRNENLPA